MRFRIISVGRERADPATPLTADYIARISKFFPIDNVVIKPAPPGIVKNRMEKELKKSGLVVAMDERGKTYTSDKFASLVESWMNNGYSEIGFVIGGADGLPKEITKRADIVISLSSMTFPHRLAKLFLSEQIYRALCYIRNIPYKK